MLGLNLSISASHRIRMLVKVAFAVVRICVCILQTGMMRVSLGDGDAAQKLLASQHDEGDDGHHQAALEACLLYGPDA